MNEDHPDHSIRRKQHFRSLKAEADADRAASERIADAIVGFFGSIPFVVFHVVWFIVWIVLNTEIWPIEPFDPFPFGLLTMVVSLEAIFLSLFVLISQNRAQKIADLREEINLHVTSQSEQEITEILKIADGLAKHLKVKIVDQKQLKNLEKDLDENRLKEQIEKEI